MANSQIDSASFRDPSGFIFKQDSVVYRQVNKVYKEHYDRLMTSGLYQELIDKNMMVDHVEVDDQQIINLQSAYKILKPQHIDFISYPYEWSFSQLKKSALLTLAIQKKAFEFGMTLKDASGYNIQFVGVKPIFIDTLSFETYVEGQVWQAYRQFCQHFLAPLALMSYVDVNLNKLLSVHLDGIPLDLASKLLPWRTRLNVSLLSHIHLHAKSQQKYASKTMDVKVRKMSKFGIRALIDSLESMIKKLTWKPIGTEWGDYYEETNYSDSGMNDKKRLVAEFIDKVNPQLIWDLGANQGVFSKIASDKGIKTLSFDVDPAAVEKHFLIRQKHKDDNLILPLILDLTNPSSAIGWDHAERNSFEQRGPAGMAMALALIHHLAISNNVPLDRVASFFQKLCGYLIIEFVPKEDSQVERLLATREDIFPEYHEAAFEKAFQPYFEIESKQSVGDSKRILYLMRNKTDLETIHSRS